MSAFLLPICIVVFVANLWPSSECKDVQFPAVNSDYLRDLSNRLGRPYQLNKYPHAEDPNACDARTQVCVSTEDCPAVLNAIQRRNERPLRYHGPNVDRTLGSETTAQTGDNYKKAVTPTICGWEGDDYRFPLVCCERSEINRFFQSGTGDDNARSYHTPARRDVTMSSNNAGEQ